MPEYIWHKDIESSSLRKDESDENRYKQYKSFYLRVKL